MERKLATLEVIKDLQPILGADNIEVATVRGWKVVVKKGEFQIGSLCVFFEIDSFLPEIPEFEFLRKSCFATLNTGETGFRIKTIKLKKQLSQGLALPLSLFSFALLTRGENSFQKKKLHKNKLYKYFDFIRVVPHKNAEVLKNFITDIGFDCQDVWVIGDSLKSDTNPGIEIGAKCILYTYHHPHYHWIQDTESVALGSFYKVDNLSDIREILESDSISIS